MDFKLLVLCVCLLCLQEITAPAPEGPHGPGPQPGPECLKHPCDVHQGLDRWAQCIVDAGNDFQCHTNQYCRVHMDKHGVNMHCEEHPTLDDCRNHEQQNAPQCDLSAGHSDPGDCTFCCSDKSCLEQLISATTAPAPTTTTTTATTIQTAVSTSQGGQNATAAVRSLVPGWNSCFTSPCGQTDDLATCTAGQYTCQQGQFCDVDITQEHGIVMGCHTHDRNYHDYDVCLIYNSHNIESCSRYSPNARCRYCCHDRSCVDILLAPTSSPMTSAPAGDHRPGKGSCFTSDCGPNVDLATCSSGQWACRARTEYCKIDAHRDGTFHMHCAPLNQNEIRHCHEGESHNGRWCYPLSNSPSADCHYCCHHPACVHSIAGATAASAVTNPGQVTVTPPPHPGKESCFTTDCDHHANIAACTSGLWACKSNEYCKFDTDKHGNIHMRCAPDGDISHCYEASHHNDHSCYPLASIPSLDCHFCCRDATCVHNITGLNAAITAGPGRTNPPSMTSAQQVVVPPPNPGKNSCFTSDCQHHDGLAACTSGQWACRGHEFCEFTLDKHGAVHMGCTSPDHMPHCALQEVTSISTVPDCYPLASVPSDDCHFCCLHAGCIYNTTGIFPTTTSTPTLITSPPTATTSQPVTTTPMQTTTTTTTTSPTSMTVGHTTSSTTGCRDLIQGNCSVLYAGQCSDLVVQKACPRTCGVCHDCTDMYLRNCSVDFPGMCNDPTVIQLCRKTCNRCSDTSTSAGASATTAGTPTTAAAATSATTPVTTAGTTVATTRGTTPAWVHCVDHYRGNCSQDFPGGCSNPVIMAACEKTCGLCSPPSNGKCTKCSLLDCLLSVQASDCAANEDYCITSVLDTSGGREITRGCATKATCDSINNDVECNDIEYHLLSSGRLCQYCCTGDDCNRPPQLLPNQADLYHKP